MQKLQHSININAPVKKVWDTMLNSDSYKDWTSVFNPGGSYFKGSWEKGSKILFIGPDPDTGIEGGMVSRIAENIPYKFVSIEHLGILKDGIEDTTSLEAQKWAPAYENYSFQEKNGVTEVRVEVDMLEDFVNLFNDMWPKALKRLKELAEI